MGQGLLKTGGSRITAAVGGSAAFPDGPFPSVEREGGVGGKAVLPGTKQEGLKTHPHLLLCSWQTLLIACSTPPGILLQAAGALPSEGPGLAQWLKLMCHASS